jgi:hypothetical protein
VVAHTQEGVMKMFKACEFILSKKEKESDLIDEIIVSYFDVYITANLIFLIKDMGYASLQNILVDIYDAPFDAAKYDLIDADKVVLQIFDRLIKGRLCSTEPLMDNLLKMDILPSIAAYNNEIAKIMTKSFKEWMIDNEPDRTHAHEQDKFLMHIEEMNTNSFSTVNFQ